MTCATRLLWVLLGAATACNGPSKSKELPRVVFDSASLRAALERFDADRERLEVDLRNQRPAWLLSSPCDDAGKCTATLDAPLQPKGTRYRVRYLKRDPGLFEITLEGLPSDASPSCADLRSRQRRFAIEGGTRTWECEPDSGGELARIVKAPTSTSVSWIKSGLLDLEQAPAK